MYILLTENLLTEQAEISRSTALNVQKADIVVISITGDSTTFTLKFEGSLDGINYFALEGTNIGSTSTTGSSTDTIGDAWRFDVRLLNFFRVNLTAITDGSVSVLARSATNFY